MAVDATGTPSPLGIPKFNTSADAPSGLGTNAIVDATDALIQARMLAPALPADGDVPVWDSGTSTWKKSSTKKAAVSGLAPGSNGQVLTVSGGVATWGGVSSVTTSRFFPLPLRVDSQWANALTRTANEAVGFMFFLPATTTISKLYMANPAVQSGNFDFGIYDSSFNAVWRYGSHAVPAVSASVAVEILVSAGTPATTPLVLSPGYYYLVSAVDNVTANLATVSAPSNGTSANRAGLSGVAALDALPLWFSKVTSFPLPNPIASPTAYTYTGTAPKVLQIEGVA